jgi:nitrate reductase assembly molybdenum cofactor insertion protein NarJ
MKPHIDFQNHYNPIEIQLAHEIAERLNDPDALSLYISYAQQFPHDKLREILNRVESLPERQIRRSRGALFTHLVNQYKQYGRDHSGN